MSQQLRQIIFLSIKEEFLSAKAAKKLKLVKKKVRSYLNGAAVAINEADVNHIRHID